MGVKYFCGATVEVEERPNRNNFVKLVRFCESWPTWPFLPLIHKKEIDTDSLPVLGLLVAKEFTVFETDIFDRNFENCKKTEYKSAEEIFDAGWNVD